MIEAHVEITVTTPYGRIRTVCALDKLHTPEVQQELREQMEAQKEGLLNPRYQNADDARSGLDAIPPLIATANVEGIGSAINPRWLAAPFTAERIPIPRVNKDPVFLTGMTVAP